jgi:hypothetical protein
MIAAMFSSLVVGLSDAGEANPDRAIRTAPEGAVLSG